MLRKRTFLKTQNLVWSYIDKVLILHNGYWFSGKVYRKFCNAYISSIHVPRVNLYYQDLRVSPGRLDEFLRTLQKGQSYWVVWRMYR